MCLRVEVLRRQLGKTADERLVRKASGESVPLETVPSAEQARRFRGRSRTRALPSWSKTAERFLREIEPVCEEA